MDLQTVFLLLTVKKLELIQYGKDPDNSVR